MHLLEATTFGNGIKRQKKFRFWSTVTILLYSCDTIAMSLITHVSSSLGEPAVMLSSSMIKNI